MKIKQNLIFAAIIVVVAFLMGWLMGVDMVVSSLAAIVFSVFSFVIMCIDDKWGPAIEAMSETENVQDT